VTSYLRLSGDDSAGVQGDGITVTGSQLVDPSGQVVEAAAPRQALSLQADMHFSVPLSDLTFCLVVRRATDYLTVYDGNITSQELGLGMIEAGSTVRIRFDHTAHLTRGQYLYTLGVYDQREGRHRIWVVPAAGLRIDEYRTYGGVADLDVETRVETLARV